MSSIFDFQQVQSVLSERDRRVITRLSADLQKRVEKSWILYTEEPGDFVIALLSLLYAGKDIHLPGVKPGKDDIKKFPVLCDNSQISDFPLNRETTGEIDPGRLVCRNNRIVFYTSGSTGQPKEVVKEFFQIENEVRHLQSLFGELVSQSIVYTTVSHQHFYGILFSILLPLVAEGTISQRRLHYPESLFSLPDGKICLISSPAFLKRITEQEGSLSDRQNTIVPFSSGGFLPPGTAVFSSHFFGHPIREIYGSTETGGIAWKLSPLQEFWKPFQIVTVMTDHDGTLAIKSPYLPDDHKYVLEDRIDLKEDGSFSLMGRNDSIVKIEEKRVALNDLENRILETGLATDAAIFSLEGKRQFIGAAIELNEKGRIQFASVEKKEINNYFRKHLSQYFHATVLPKKWRYPEKMPVNSQGKILRKEIKELFSNNLVDHPRILSEEEVNNGWTFTVVFPGEYRYFDGHFPEMKILPAVVQVDYVLSVLKEKTGLTPVVDRIPRMKFQNPIFPDLQVKVNIIWDREKRKVSFEFSSEDGTIKYSKGNVFVKI